MKVAVIDGQGGGVGKLIIESICEKIVSRDITIIALGTNALATSAMLKAGAHEGATGENAICVNAGEVHVIAGAVGIIMANSMMGELTPLMAQAIGISKAQKVLLPINRCRIDIVGVSSESLPVLVNTLVAKIKSIIDAKAGGV